MVEVFFVAAAAFALAGVGVVAAKKAACVVAKWSAVEDDAAKVWYDSVCASRASRSWVEG